MDRQVILKGVIQILNNQREVEFKEKYDCKKEELKNSLKVANFEAAIAEYEDLAKDLIEARDLYIRQELIKQVGYDFNIGLDYSDKDIIAGRLELLDEEVLRNLTLEEIASLVRV